MTTAYAEASGLQLDATVRQALIHRTSTPPQSEWMKRAMREIRAFEYHICDRWGSLDPQTKEFLHSALLGAVKPTTFSQRFDAALWSVSTVWNMAFRRDESVKYLIAIFALLEKINGLVGQEVWRKVATSEERKARARRGHEDISTGRISVLYSAAK